MQNVHLNIFKAFCERCSHFRGLMVSFFGGAVVPLTPGRTILDELFILKLHNQKCPALHAIISVSPCMISLRVSSTTVVRTWPKCFSCSVLW